MLIESIWLIIFGLGFDIIGAGLIISPLWNLVSKNHPFGRDENKGQEFAMVDVNHRYREDQGSQRNARIGVFFLIFGFILQMIGNWLQNPPSF